MKLKSQFRDDLSEGGTDDTMDSEESLQVKVSSLEKKVQDQSSELICLRSTLSEVLSRIRSLEGREAASTKHSSSSCSPSPPPKSTSSSSSSSSHHHPPPKRSGTVKFLLHPKNGTPNGPSVTFNLPNGCKPRSGMTSPLPFFHLPSSASEPSGSSKSASPISSPLPFQTKTNLKSRYGSTSNLSTMKRWSNSQEFNGNGHGNIRRCTSGSMLNLHIRSSPVPQLKHGTKETSLNHEDGIVKMYLRGRPISMHIPTVQNSNYSLQKVNPAPPHRLRIEWVHGYRGRDCRSNLYWLPTGEILYCIASVAILYNVEDQIQRHYLGHTDDIKCMTLHPNKLLVATGQVASIDRRDRRCRPLTIDVTSPDAAHWPHVRIWDSVSLNTLQVIGVGEFERAVNCVAFSQADGGSLLCVVDDSQDHTLSLWDWQKSEHGHKITETKCAAGPVLAAEFHPLDSHTLVTVGRGHVHIWNAEGYTLSKKVGIFEKHNKPKYVQCIAFTDMGDLLTGDSSGNISVWARGYNKVCRTIGNVHDGGVFSICVLKDGTFVTGGGKDFRIVQWDLGVKRPLSEATLPDNVGGVRMITRGKGNILLIGTTKNCILQGTMTHNFEVVVQGHTEDVSMLAVHPTDSHFITGGHDHKICLWDTLSHRVVWTKDIGETPQAGCFSPEGNAIVVATTEGRWIVMDVNTRQTLSIHTDSNEPVTCVKFSPDGNFLAIGSHDKYIYVYNVSDDYKKYSRIGRCAGHSNPVLNIDWSEDSTNLQSCSSDHELLYWNATVCRQLTSPAAIKDVTWSSQSCTVGFNVLGIWPENSEGPDVLSCDKSRDNKLLVTGDDFGKVKLYSYPACQPKSLHHTYSGHSSQVPAVSFLQDGHKVVSLGGRDCSVIQWSLH
ncbi:echinoderm microtubule-associated protein-like 2 isoform X1 [Centruroides vittatus]|uniref:echinoderm microtubule-associated protein-like 2 isoform X1 n=1 Tax=Centruroides vittatus TaxID=120091 RepID=UPI00350FE93A